MIPSQQDQTAYQPSNLSTAEAIRLFSNYIRVTGVAHTRPELQGDARLIGKRLGLLNGSSWISLWANYFGRMFLPGLHLVNAGNEAVQINFMEAHSAGLTTPPEVNIAAFQHYAIDLVELGHVNAVLITCSTMNRAYPAVQEVLQPYGISVYQIDRPMMQQAVRHGGKILVIATHGPTVESTKALLQEVARETDHELSMIGVVVEEAWNSLSKGETAEHNFHLAEVIKQHLRTGEIGCVVLAQLSMTVFLLSYPDPMKEFGIPVFTSGECGFKAIREVLASKI